MQMNQITGMAGQVDLQPHNNLFESFGSPGNATSHPLAEFLRSRLDSDKKRMTKPSILLKKIQECNFEQMYTKVKKVEPAKQMLQTKPF